MFQLRLHQRTSMAALRPQAWSYSESCRVITWGAGRRWPMGNHLCSPGCGWGNVAKLVGMFDMFPGPRTLGQFDEQLPTSPHREQPMPLTHLHHTSSHRRRRRQPIQDAIVGEVAIPADFALFGGEAFPGKGGRQRHKRLALTAFSRTCVGGAMDAGIEALAPG